MVRADLNACTDFSRSTALDCCKMLPITPSIIWGYRPWFAAFGSSRNFARESISPWLVLGQGSFDADDLGLDIASGVPGVAPLRRSRWIT